VLGGGLTHPSQAARKTVAGLLDPSRARLHFVFSVRGRSQGREHISSGSSSRGLRMGNGMRTRVTRGEGQRVLMAAASAAAASLLLVVVVGLVLPRQGLRSELDSLPPHWHKDVDSNGRCGSSERACLDRAISGSNCALNLRC